ncbi:hypothetical protein [Streptosporangium album]
MAVLVVVGLAVSLIAITLRNISESGGRTPQWPVSWPEPPVNLPQQQLDVSSQEAAPQDAAPKKADVPRQRASLPRSGVNRHH